MNVSLFGQLPAYIGAIGIGRDEKNNALNSGNGNPRVTPSYLVSKGLVFDGTEQGVDLYKLPESAAPPLFVPAQGVWKSNPFRATISETGQIRWVSLDLTNTHFV